MSLLFDLLEPNELDNYLFDIISDETMERMKNIILV